MKSLPVSRVLSWVVIYLGCTSRCTSSDRTRRSAGNVIPSYSVLLQTGFTWHDSHLPSGGLLPHLFTLTSLRGGISLWHWPVAHANWALPSVLPFGARTFLSRNIGSDYLEDSSEQV